MVDGRAPKLLALLAQRRFSIFYMSTATQDLILVMSHELHEIIACLAEHDVSVRADSDVSSVVTLPPEEAAVSAAADIIQLRRLSDEFFLHSVPVSDLERLLKPILNIFFVNAARQNFVAFSIVDDEISLILDRAASKLMAAYTDVNFQQAWTAFRVLGDWGFSETGLVSSISSTLTDAGIDGSLFMSTFSRDYFIVQSDLVPRSVDAFQSAGISVHSDS
uniref:CASTOR ACT domain-containing protein n=1 Tax=Spongospora subterranea TaxID=70186 RepID=A0A0H5RC99_9EUKA|eukprot:CRZ11855.1 hypothetical protein [Spongospora subterranea]